jgi:hypothetical protein
MKEKSAQKDTENKPKKGEEDLLRDQDLQVTSTMREKSHCPLRPFAFRVLVVHSLDVVAVVDLVLHLFFFFPSHRHS